MKNLFNIMLCSVFFFCGCNNDDDKTSFVYSTYRVEGNKFIGHKDTIVITSLEDNAQEIDFFLHKKKLTFRFSFNNNKISFIHNDTLITMYNLAKSGRFTSGLFDSLSRKYPELNYEFDLSPYFISNSELIEILPYKVDSKVYNVYSFEINRGITSEEPNCAFYTKEFGFIIHKTNNYEYNQIVDISNKDKKEKASILINQILADSTFFPYPVDFSIPLTSFVDSTQKKLEEAVMKRRKGRPYPKY